MDEPSLSELRRKWAPVAQAQNQAAVTSQAARIVMPAGGGAGAGAGAIDATTTGGGLSMAQLEAIEARKAELAKATPASTSAPSKLDNLQVCIECDGLGQVKRWYNHMQLTQDCPTCKGEGIVERKKYKLVEKDDDDADAEGGVPPLEDI